MILPDWNTILPDWNTVLPDWNTILPDSHGDRTEGTEECKIGENFYTPDNTKDGTIH